MKREIKFRAWNGKVKKMYSDVPLITLSSHVKEKDETLNKSLQSLQSDSVGFILMQYTGLKDKNGKEIYEGDILRKTWSHEMFVVEWDINEGGYQHQSDCDEYVEEVKTGIRYKGTEIIGNVWENPELLAKQ